MKGWCQPTGGHVAYPHVAFGCQSDEPLASLVITNRVINVHGFLVVIMLPCMLSFIVCILLGMKLSLQYHYYPTDSPTATRLGLCISVSKGCIDLSYRWARHILERCLAQYPYITSHHDISGQMKETAKSATFKDPSDFKHNRSSVSGIVLALHSLDKAMHLFMQSKRNIFQLKLIPAVVTDCYQHIYGSWWRHQMEALLALCEGNPPVTAGFPSQRPVMRIFNVFFDLRLNKRLSKQSRGR